MSTIYDLPLENIEFIIYIACALVDTGRRERYRFLKAIALVDRNWTPFAQTALWLDVKVDRGIIVSFHATGPARYPEQKLWISPHSANLHFVETVLRHVQGVRDLTLKRVFLEVDWGMW